MCNQLQGTPQERVFVVRQKKTQVISGWKLAALFYYFWRNWREKHLLKASMPLAQLVAYEVRIHHKPRVSISDTRIHICIRFGPIRIPCFFTIYGKQKKSSLGCRFLTLPPDAMPLGPRSLGTAGAAAGYDNSMLVGRGTLVPPPPRGDGPPLPDVSTPSLPCRMLVDLPHQSLAGKTLAPAALLRRDHSVSLVSSFF